MEKDMEYYIQVSGRIMKDNLDKRKSLKIGRAHV